MGDLIWEETDLIALDVRSKTALRGKTDPLLLRVSKDLSSFINTTGDLPRIFKLRKFRTNQPKNNSLILRQLLQWLEIPRAGRIVYSLAHQSPGKQNEENYIPNNKYRN